MQKGVPGDLFEQFESLFGELFQRRTARDLSQPLVVELAEAANGGQRTIELERATVCRACDGRGGAPGATFETCAKCEGRSGAHRIAGAFTYTATCDACHGAGGRWSVRCASCEGARETRATKSLRVAIPPGVVDGQVLRLAGQGNDLGDGGKGDALLTIAVASHPALRREGDDLHARARLEGELAQRGGETRVAWLDGTVRVRVPAGAKHGTTARVRGWGCVRLGQPYAPPPSDDAPYRSAAVPARGDLIVTFVTRDEEARDEEDALGDALVERALRAHEDPPALGVGGTSRALVIGLAVITLATAIAMLLVR
ncbi:MAG: hypothetical protein M3Y87_31350 [Myxococcota bacterium]|nr:hypothetical protein [Myxococcota bacterium]